MSSLSPGVSGCGVVLSFALTSTEPEDLPRVASAILEPRMAFIFDVADLSEGAPDSAGPRLIPLTHCVAGAEARNSLVPQTSQVSQSFSLVD